MGAAAITPAGHAELELGSPADARTSLRAQVPERRSLWAGSEPAKLFGFDGSRFNGFIERDGDIIVIGGIVVRIPGTGAFTGLVSTILEAGFAVVIPVTSPDLLVRIARRKGFERDTIRLRNDLTDVWIRYPSDRDRAGAL